jgi:hypothetical protein
MGEGLVTVRHRLLRGVLAAHDLQPRLELLEGDLTRCQRRLLMVHAQLPGAPVGILRLVDLRTLAAVGLLLGKNVVVRGARQGVEAHVPRAWNHGLADASERDADGVEPLPTRPPIPHVPVGVEGHVRLFAGEPLEVRVPLVGDGLIVGLILRRMRVHLLLLGVGSLAEPEFLILPVGLHLGLLRDGVAFCVGGLVLLLADACLIARDATPESVDVCHAPVLGALLGRKPRQRHPDRLPVSSRDRDHAVGGGGSRRGRSGWRCRSSLRRGTRQLNVLDLTLGRGPLGHGLRRLLGVAPGGGQREVLDRGVRISRGRRRSPRRQAVPVRVLGHRVSHGAAPSGRGSRACLGAGAGGRGPRGRRQWPCACRAPGPRGSPARRTCPRRTSRRTAP